MTSLIDTSFVVDRMGETFTAVEQTQLGAFIEDASAIVLDVGDGDWTSATVPASVKAIVFQMVRRAYTNPDGYSSEAIGDYRYSRSGEVEAGGMALTKREYVTVRRAAGLSNVTTVGVRRPNAYERQFITDLLQEDELVL